MTPPAVRGMIGAMGLGGRPDRWDGAIVVYAAGAAFCRPLTAPAVAAVLLAGGALIALAARRRTRAPRRAPVPRRAVAPWAVLATLFAAWELVAISWGNDPEHPTISLLLDPVLDTYPGRFAGWVAWLAAGRWLVGR